MKECPLCGQSVKKEKRGYSAVTTKPTSLAIQFCPGVVVVADLVSKLGKAEVSSAEFSVDT